jgi:hypothetical protein
MRFFTGREFNAHIYTCTRGVTRIIVPIDRHLAKMPVKLKKIDNELHLIFKTNRNGGIKKPMDESTSGVQRITETGGENCLSA